MNWTGQIADFFVSKGKLSLLMVIALFFWGVISFIKIPKQYNPTIVAPAFQVVVNYPGASKNETLEKVTKPLENIITDIAGVEDVFSITTRGGQSIVNVAFFVGEDLNEAKIALNDRIQSDINLAPYGIQDPQIISLDPDDVPVLSLTVNSKEKDGVALRKFGFQLRDRLRTIPGASRIQVIGGRRKELSILLNPNKMRGTGVTLRQIEEAILSNNLYLPAGVIKGDDLYTPIEAFGNVDNVGDVSQIVVVAGDMGEIKLGQLASIKENLVEREEYIRHLTSEGVESDNVVLLSVAKIRGSNISDITERVKLVLSDLKQSFIPNDVEVKVIVDEGVTAFEEISGLITNLVTSIIIVILVLLFFLDIRAAALVTVTIPLTLLTVFGIANLTGQNINRITLFALILSLGLLVDSATVVVENIVRHLKDASSKDLKRTIVKAVSEVGPGLFMSTVTTVFAFVPLAFISGMMGPYMGPIPFFVPAALIVSLLISYSLSPWMASVILKAGADKDSEDKKETTFAKLGSGILNIYESTLRTVLLSRRISWSLLLGTLVILGGVMSFPVFKWVTFRMLPKADVEQFFVYIDTPQGTSLEKTLKVTKSYEKLMLKHPEVKMVQSYVGHPPILDFNGLFRGVSARRQPHLGTIRVGLTDSDNRDVTSEKIVFKMRKQLLVMQKEAFPDLNIKLKIIEDPPGPPVMSTVLVRVQGHDEQLISQIAKEIQPTVFSVEEVVDKDISLPDNSKTIRLDIKHLEASRRRVTPAQIVNALQTLYKGKTLGVYHQKNTFEEEYIKLRLDKQFRLDKSVLNQIYLHNIFKNPVRLSDLVDIVEVDTVPALRRENRLSTVYLSGEMGDRSVTYAGIDLLFFLHKYRPRGPETELVDFSLFGASYKLADGRELKVNIGGEWELTLEVFRDLMIAMGVAMFLIYFVLVAQFESFSQPLIIMSTIPLSLLGVMPGFLVLNLVQGEYFTATSMIGVIALAGIAVNNSIILLETINALKKEGMELFEALVLSGRMRFRPIILTSVTTILGSMTIVSDPVWSGLAYAIIMGLGMSAALTLMIFPTLYYVVVKD